MLRIWSFGCVALLGSALGPCPAAAGARDAAWLRDHPAGTIGVRTGERGRYLLLGGGRALRYPIAVGMRSKQWFGRARITGKYVRPAWSPPAEVKRDKPWLPDVIPGGDPGNPMGARALTLDRDEYVIHGTTARMRRSIGTAASYGCFRMLDEDVIDLYRRVRVGTPVVVLR